MLTMPVLTQMLTRMRLRDTFFLVRDDAMRSRGMMYQVLKFLARTSFLEVKSRYHVHFIDFISRDYARDI